MCLSDTGRRLRSDSFAVGDHVVRVRREERADAYGMRSPSGPNGVESTPRTLKRPSLPPPQRASPSGSHWRLDANIEYGPAIYSQSSTPCRPGSSGFRCHGTAASPVLTSQSATAATPHRHPSGWDTDGDRMDDNAAPAPKRSRHRRWPDARQRGNRSRAGTPGLDLRT